MSDYIPITFSEGVPQFLAAFLSLTYYHYFFDFLFNLTFFPLFFTPFLIALNFMVFSIFLSCWDFFRSFVSFDDFFSVLSLSSECFLFFPGCVVFLEALFLRAFGKSSKAKDKQQTIHTVCRWCYTRKSFVEFVLWHKLLQKKCLVKQTPQWAFIAPF